MLTRNHYAVFLWCSLALLLVISCVPRGAIISISGFSPQTGLPGTIIKIQGVGFDPIPFNNSVSIGGSKARVISGDQTHLRVVALRDLASGLIVVETGPLTATSAKKFRREGNTSPGTAFENSGSELIEGRGFDVDVCYDMSAQGLNQKILVVLATPSDVNPEDLAPAGQTAREAVIDELTATNEYFVQASYNQVSAAFTTTPDWIPLSQIRDFYAWQQDDIDREQARVDAAQADLDALNMDPAATQEQIDQAEEDLETAKASLGEVQNDADTLQRPNFLFAEALIGAKAAVPDFDTFSDYLVIVAGPFLRGYCCWIENGFHAEWTVQGLQFDIDFPEPKGITYVSQEASWDRITHELSHFFASGDLYSESFADGSFLEGNAGPFAMMGKHNQKPLYIGYNMETWLDYFDESANGNVKFLEWGSVADFDQSFDIVAHSKTEDPVGNATVHLLRLKVTDGLFYYVEVRQRPDPSLGADADYVFDPQIPLDPSNPAWQGGVIIHKAVENNNQSNNNERQVTLLPPARMLQVGDVVEDPTRTIKISVAQRLSDRPAKYRVRVEWGHLPAPDPNGQFDLRITPWTPPPWESVDIWANSTKNDETSPAKIIYKNHEPGDDTKPIGNGDPPWVMHDNTLFARITNQGMVATPESVKVTFYVTLPSAVGDNNNWAPFDTVDVGILAAGETRIVEANRTWRPAVGEHTCVKVEIHAQTGEITFGNNRAQENFSEFETGAASPYAPVEFDFLARNPYEAPVVMDLRARDVPTDWFVALDQGSVWLPPLGEKKVHALIWTDRAAEWSQEDQRKAPRKVLINIEGWADRWGDQVFAVGGITAFVQAVRQVRIEIEPRPQGNLRQPFFVAGRVVPAAGINPIAIHIIDPDGNFITERTITDGAGRFTYQTRYLAKVRGIYRVQAFVLGGSLAGQAESDVLPVIVP